MSYSPQNFVNGQSVVSANWLNGVDQMVYNILGGWQGQSLAIVQAALGIPVGGFAVPVQIAQGGTGQITSAAGLAALGGITSVAALALINAGNVGKALYPVVAGEGLSVVNTQYSYGNILRYGADPTGVNASDAAMVAAIAANAEIYIPPGTYTSANQTVVFPSKTIYGSGREGTTWNYTGTSSAFRLINQASGTTSSPNSSGYGLNNIYGFTIALTNAANTTNAALEINACGFAYYSIHHMRLTGTGGKWGLILDGVEVSSVYENIIECCGNTAGTNTVSAALWITDGPDRTTGQRQGYSNDITIWGNQINNAYYGILDDGGSLHNYLGNNLNGAMIPARFANVQGGVFIGNEIENVWTTYYGIANLYFHDETLSGAVTSPDTMPPASAPFGGVKGFGVFGNFFGANLAVSSSTVVFAASASGTFHTVDLHDNVFRSNLGVSATINCLQAGGSRFYNNYDEAAGSVQHYSNAHVDGNGNDYGEPALGSTCGFSQAARVFGRTGLPHLFGGGVQCQGPLNPSTPAQATQTGAVYQGSGVPSNGVANNGDMYFRTDTPATVNQRIYIKSAGSWVGIL